MISRDYLREGETFDITFFAEFDDDEPIRVTTTFKITVAACPNQTLGRPEDCYLGWPAEFEIVGHDIDAGLLAHVASLGALDIMAMEAAGG